MIPAPPIFITSFAEFAEFDMGLFGCALLVGLVVLLAVISIVIEEAWLVLRRLWKLAKGAGNGR
ncbi:hypothetical protein [Stenotrophomonas maltophilia]|uniref:hypothetical protein n=1 Tax=Stenotrophomonas maltophilia TaxID=40324 RepID=UPI00240E6EF5|nr:hypothetical protein [Stenotrophomonas maltophilia]MDG2509295.1 hypothetical protein [Stenotrophomonas maltophilia]